MRTCSIIAAIALAAVATAQSPVPTGTIDYAALAARVGSTVAWYRSDPVLLAEGRNRNEVSASQKEHATFDRGAVLDEVLTHAREQRRVAVIYLPRVLAGLRGRQMYRPAVLDTYMMATVFSDPVCVDLLNRRFVTARLICDDVVGKRLGVVAPETVEPALVFLRPDGTVVKRIGAIRSFGPAWLIAALRQALVDEPDLAGDDAVIDGDDDGAAVLDRLFRDGRWEAVVARTGPAELAELPLATRVRAGVARARALRLLGRLEEAHATLDELDLSAVQLPVERRARQHAAAGAVACERGQCYLAERRMPEAEAAFSRVVTRVHRGEAQYQLGLCHVFGGREDLAVRCFKEAAAVDPEGIFGAKAAINLVDGPDRQPVGPALLGFEDPFPCRLAGGAPGDTTWPADVAETEDLAARAVEFLLRMQRSHGGWADSRYAYWGASDYTPNVWVAVSSLACAALLEWRHLAPEAIDEALERGEHYVFDRRNVNPDYNEEVYSHAYKLVYLARRYDHARDDGARAESVRVMNETVRDLARIQQNPELSEPGAGLWAHEYPNPFSTAAALDALELVRARGADVPQKLMRDGAKALLAVRDDDGGFAYASRRSESKPETLEERLKNSCGRAPICEAAILWSGDPAGSPAKVSTAVERFWTYLPRLAAVRRCDFHTDGELAGFFFWHSMYHTSQAFGALPAEEQLAHRQRLRDFLLQLAEIDGSFIDSHEMGKAYGTAMGLLTLKNVLDEKRP